MRAESRSVSHVKADVQGGLAHLSAEGWVLLDIQWLSRAIVCSNLWGLPLQASVPSEEAKGLGTAF